MPTEQDSVQTADLSPLLSQQYTPLEWVNFQLSTLPPLSLRNDASILLKWTTYIDSLLWQLQQAELKKNVEFESTARRYTGQLPTIQAKIRDMRMVHRGVSPLQVLKDGVADIEVRVDRLRELLNSKQVEKLQELRKKKEHLKKVMRVGALELEWRTVTDQMKQAMEGNDLDCAQNSLEKLDDIFSTHWSDNLRKKKLLTGLRQELVTLIKNNL